MPVRFPHQFYVIRELITEKNFQTFDFPLKATSSFFEIYSLIDRICFIASTVGKKHKMFWQFELIQLAKASEKKYIYVSVINAYVL